MNTKIDPWIARIALSLYASGRKVERVPKIVEIHPSEICTLAGRTSDHFAALDGTLHYSSPRFVCPLGGI